MSPPRRRLSDIKAVLAANNPNPAPSRALLQRALTASARCDIGYAGTRARIKAGKKAGAAAGSKAGNTAGTKAEEQVPPDGLDKAASSPPDPAVKQSQSSTPSASATVTAAAQSAAAPPVTASPASGLTVRVQTVGRPTLGAQDFGLKSCGELNSAPRGFDTITVAVDVPGVWSTAVSGAASGACLAVPVLSIRQMTEYLEGSKTAGQALMCVAAGTGKAAALGAVICAGVAAAPCVAPVAAVAGACGLVYWVYDASQAVYGLACCVRGRCSAAPAEEIAEEQVPVPVQEQGNVQIQLEPLPPQYEDAYFCYVTHDSMKDPFVLSSGHSVDATAFPAMPRFCPATNEPVRWWVRNLAMADFRLRYLVDQATGRIPLPFPLRRNADGSQDPNDPAIPCWVDQQGVSHADPGSAEEERPRNVNLIKLMRAWTEVQLAAAPAAEDV